VLPWPKLEIDVSQDHVRRLQGLVKQHDGPPIGTVMQLDPSGESDSWNPATAARSIFAATACSRRLFPSRRRLAERRGALKAFDENQ
jgi:hypothetical protein